MLMLKASSLTVPRATGYDNRNRAQATDHTVSASGVETCHFEVQSAQRTGFHVLAASFSGIELAVQGREFAIIRKNHSYRTRGANAAGVRNRA